MMHFEMRATIRAQEWRDLIAALTHAIRQEENFRDHIRVAPEDPRQHDLLFRHRPRLLESLRALRAYLPAPF